MTYAEALAELEVAARRGMRLGLERVRALCQRLGDPQRGRPGVLVAGTNGKGSVCAFSDAMLRAAGHRSLLLTKPHLTSYRERIQVDGRPVSEEEFAGLIEETAAAGRALPPAVGPPTHHELITAAGFLAAVRLGAGVIVCEVGLGGRLDATNIYDGGVAVITTVGLDHQAQLGPTVEAIAAEKAAIIKPGNGVVTGCAGGPLDVVRAAAARADAPLLVLGETLTVAAGPPPDPPAPRSLTVTAPAGRWDDCHVSLPGEIQVANAAIAVGAVSLLAGRGLPVDGASVRQGLRGARWPGRLQLVGADPPLLVDGGHNPHAVAAVLCDLRRLAAGRPTILCFGAMDDKDHREMLALLTGLRPRRAVLTGARSPRATDPELLLAEWTAAAETAALEAPGLAAPDVAAAVALARGLAGPSGIVIVCGSIYVVGEALAAVGEGLPPDPVPAAAAAGR